MKLGTENTKKVAVAGVLLLIAVFVGIRGFYSLSPGNPGGPGGLTLPIGKTPITALPDNLDPRLQLDLLKNAENVEYQGNGRNIFRASVEPPPKDLPTAVAPVMKPEVNLPPPPPPINLKFFGFASKPGSSNSEVFLAQGDDVFVAKVGDIVDRRYRVLRITPSSVEVEDVISNVRQTLPLSQG